MSHLFKISVIVVSSMNLCHTDRMECVNQYDKCQWSKVRPLRHTSNHLHPVGHYVYNHYPVKPVLEKGAHPTDDDIWQVQCTHLSHQDVVVDMVKRLGKIDEHSVHRLALIDSVEPVMHHVYQCACCRPSLNSAVLVVVKFAGGSF